MPTTHDIYLEVGTRRVFACSVEWPGWCRSGRDEESAIEALAAYADRYRSAIARARKGFEPGTLKVVERVTGNATTDFGAPGLPARLDERKLSDGEAKRFVSLLKAAWRSFDEAAEAASGTRLTTGPRSGGRTVKKMVDHVREAQGAYLSGLGGLVEKNKRHDTEAIRDAYVEAVLIRASGGDAPKPKRSGKLWPVRYAIRRSAWHALDHAWEIEDRST
ncbi:MAG TPA: hypothetical protein VKA30_07035 [Actinomycetota bacterium]|nr:hypothetical protein [Actinomycetota bacterium]